MQPLVDMVHNTMYDHIEISTFILWITLLDFGYPICYTILEPEMRLRTGGPAEHKYQEVRKMLYALRSLIQEDGSVNNWESIVNLMDDETREQIASDWGDVLTEAEFLEAYCNAHLDKYGEEFAI